MNVQVIRVNGDIEAHQIVHRSRALDQIHKLIGADTCDTVNLRDGRVMFVDDNGYETETVDHGGGHFELKPIRARKPVNSAATAIYHGICVPGTTHQILGDVAIVQDEDFA